MKKFIYSVTMIASMVLMLVGCGKKDDDKDDKTTEGITTEAKVTEDNQSKPEADTENNNLNAKVIADELLAGGEYSETLQELSKEVALARLYSIDADKIEDAAFYTNSQATAEEIAVIKVKSEADVTLVKDSFNTRIADQKEACVDYLPDEMPKLENAIVYSNGCYVILSISVDSTKIDAIISDLFK